MASILSEHEVESLVGGISQGKVRTGTDAPKSGAGLKPYDFSAQHGPLHLRMPALEVINERFLGSLRRSLSAATGAELGVALSATESIRFAEFCNSLTPPTGLQLFKMAPLRGLALLVLEGPLVFALVEAFFGGRGAGEVKLEGRGFTPIESKIMDKVAKSVLGDLQEAWSQVLAVEITPVRAEIDPQFAAIVPGTDVVIASTFKVELENGSGLMKTAIPYGSLEPAKDALQQGLQEESQGVDQSWRREMIKKIRELRVDLSCTLGTATIRAKELLEVKVDQVIELHQKTGDPAVVKVEGIPKFLGHPGTYRNKKAIRIAGRFTEE